MLRRVCRCTPITATTAMFACYTFTSSARFTSNPPIPTDFVSANHSPTRRCNASFSSASIIHKRTLCSHGIASSCTSSAVLRSTRRALSHVTNAANFETEVIQSQQAICLIYHIHNTNCASYLKTAERQVDALNAQTTELEVTSSTVAPAALSMANQTEDDRVLIEDASGQRISSTDSSTEDAAVPPAQPHKPQWLKLCTINADENRNLASAFSVERAKLPITYFVMQGTIVDKVMGHVSEARLERILMKFLEHYQKEMNVDLLTRRRDADGASSGRPNSNASPLPSAATADLLSGSSTVFLQDKLMNALVGADMIQLPEEAEKLDGLRKTLQEAKKKAHTELQDLNRQLGIDIRRLSEVEMQSHYYNSTTFHAMAVLSALEALFLARAYATLGDVSKVNVEWAKRAVLNDFESIQGDPTLRRVLALVEVNLVRGELRTAANLAAQDANRLSSVLSFMDASDTSVADHRRALQEMLSFVGGQSQYCLDLLRIIDANVDSRTLEGSEFPSSVADSLFDMLKVNLKLSRTRLPAQQQQQSEKGDSEDAEKMVMEALIEGKALDTTAKRVRTAQARVPQLRTVVTSLVQLYPTDPRAQAARSRLSSLLY